MTERWKTSLGIWAFGATATRFVPGGYHPEAVEQSTVEKVRRAVDGLGPLIDGYEFHYGAEITEENTPQIQAALGKEHDIYCVCYGLVPNPRYMYGSLSNPEAGKRREAVNHLKAGIDLSAAVGGKYIYWPGNEGYNYPFQRNYAKTWGWLLEGIQEAVEHANAKQVTFLLEHKNSEPAMNIFMRNIGMSLFIVKKIKEMGTDIANLKINMDWQHLIMNGENLGEYGALLLSEGLLGHQHGNSGWGSFDDDNMVGTQFIEQQIDLIRELIQGGYGKNGERIGFDLFPYTEDPVEAVKRSVMHFEYMAEIARRMDNAELEAAKNEADAVRAYRAFWRALGLDEAFERQVYEKYARR